MIDGARPSGPAGRVGGEPERRAPRPIAPELIAAILVAFVIATIGGGVIAVGSSPGAATTPPLETPGGSGIAAPTPALDDAAIATCLEIDGRLAVDRAALDAEVAASPFQASNVATILRGLNADVVVATAAATRLQRLPISAAVGARLTTFYRDLHTHVSDALVNSVQNAGAYRTAARTTSTMLAELPVLDTLLRGLRDARPSPPASPPGPSPSAASSGSPPPSVSAPPSTPPGSPTVPASPAVVNILVNPGFESGVGSPWELSVSGSGTASWSADSAVHAGGSTSARVEIAAAGVERTAVVVRQGGLSIEAGSHYVATISVRAESVREVRLRIASAAGDSYVTRLFMVGPDWQVLTVDSTVFATDANAYLEVDLGRFGATTWLDDASFGRVAPGG